jgi:hypothetical protein
VALTATWVSLSSNYSSHPANTKCSIGRLSVKEKVKAHTDDVVERILLRPEHLLGVLSFFPGRYPRGSRSESIWSIFTKLQRSSQVLFVDGKPGGRARRLIEYGAFVRLTQARAGVRELWPATPQFGPSSWRDMTKLWRSCGVVHQHSYSVDQRVALLLTVPTSVILNGEVGRVDLQFLGKRAQNMV